MVAVSAAPSRRNAAAMSRATPGTMMKRVQPLPPSHEATSTDAIWMK